MGLRSFLLIMSENTDKSVDNSTKIDKNSTKNSTKIDTNSVDNSTKSTKDSTKSTTDKPVVVERKDGSKVLSTKSVDNSIKDSTKSVESETKIDKPKRKVSTKSLENLNRKGRKPKESTKSVDNSVEIPQKTNFNFPIKAVIIAAFIAGATIGGFGLWKWWQNKKKAEKEQINPDAIYTDVPEEYFEDTQPEQQISQEDLDKMAKIQEAQENFK